MVARSGHGMQQQGRDVLRSRWWSGGRPGARPGSSRCRRGRRCRPSSGTVLEISGGEEARARVGLRLVVLGLAVGAIPIELGQGEMCRCQRGHQNDDLVELALARRLDREAGRRSWPASRSAAAGSRAGRWRKSTSRRARPQPCSRSITSFPCQPEPRRQGLRPRGWHARRHAAGRIAPRPPRFVRVVAERRSRLMAAERLDRPVHVQDSRRAARQPFHAVSQMPLQPRQSRRLVDRLQRPPHRVLAHHLSRPQQPGPAARPSSPAQQPGPAARPSSPPQQPAPAALGFTPSQCRLLMGAYRRCPASTDKSSVLSPAFAVVEHISG